MKPEQCRPSRRLVRAALLALGLALVAETWHLWMGPEPAGGALLRELWLAAVAVLAALVALDRIALGREQVPEVRRRLPRNLALHDWAEVTLEVAPGASRLRRLELFDSAPASAQTEGLPLSVALRDARSQHARVAVSYRLRPLRRGDARFERPVVRAASPFGLWQFTARCGSRDSVRVYPNFAAVARLGDMETARQTEQVGIRLRQRRGEGLEFHQLREYRLGDAMRQIDWKATSRKQDLISREYQDERDQQVIFLLDCSRRMRARDDALSHFDHCLNSMILLAHVALRSGDAVGMLSFGDETRWLPPRKGAGSVTRLLNAVYDVEATTQGTDFSAAAEELTRRQGRRALVILLTNVRREDVDDLLPAVALLRRRHLVLVANLRHEKIEAVQRRPVDDFRGALRYLGAWQHGLARQQVSEAIARAGVLGVDATPGTLHAHLINRYYAIKRSGEL